ncbi:hypothetical protein Zm00014a_037084 [Zea mays]|jgi:hypothetical protein|uniref:Uncharacterized protein n=2 Tax=Zea mays TaxID=4577 RepID=K7VCN3_MAIZE|nr:hypothetical protein ZEAMMB73_Zm00001d047151 [Zea mays]PWZ07746.1 hypothetical protein Zm00014a_037084 [Zea mays]
MVMEAVTAASRAEVDTSRPFQSVREAVKVFGERRHAGRSGSSNGSSASSSVKLGASDPAPASPASVMLEYLKKLEDDLAEAKGEVVELRQRQAQMEVAVSSLSEQFSKGLAVYSSLSKGKEVAAAVGEGDSICGGHGRVRSHRWDESRAEEWVASLEYLPRLSEALAIKMVEDDLGHRKERKVKNKAGSRAKKHKSGIALRLIGGMFCSKKARSSRW